MSHPDEPPQTQREDFLSWQRESLARLDPTLVSPDAYSLSEAPPSDCSNSEFGFSASCPICVNGTYGEWFYLNRLRVASGAYIFYHRLGSVQRPMAAGSVNVWETLARDGSQRDIIFVDKYYEERSAGAPDGFRLRELDIHDTFTTSLYKLPLRGTNCRLDVFPDSLLDLFRQQLDTLTEAESILRDIYSDNIRILGDLLQSPLLPACPIDAIAKLPFCGSVNEHGEIAVLGTHTAQRLHTLQYLLPTILRRSVALAERGEDAMAAADYPSAILNLQKAIRVLTPTVEIVPSMPLALLHNNLGLAYTYGGNYPEAYHHYQIVQDMVDAAPESQEEEATKQQTALHYNLACTHSICSRLDEAMKHALLFLESEPHSRSELLSDPDMNNLVQSGLLS